MKSIKYKLLFCFTIFIVLPFFAQNLQFKHYGLPEGLPQEAVTCMAKDKLGFLWIGSQNGVSRFDGLQFLSLATMLDNDGLEGSKITNLVVDSKNIIWIGTSQNGLYAYDIILQKLKQIGKKNLKVASVIRGADNTIYASYLGDGVYKIQPNGNNFKLEKIIENQTQATNLSILRDNLIFSTLNGKLSVYNLQNSKVKIIQKSLGKINKLVNINENVWICSNSGLFKINSNFTNLDAITLKNISNKTAIFDIATINSHYFLATNNGLIECIEHQTQHNEFEVIKQYISKKKYELNAPNGNVIQQLLAVDDLLFLGGINLDVTQVSNAKIIKLFNKELPVGDPSVFSFFKHQNYFFIGTSNGLVVKNTKNNTYKKVQLTNKRVISIKKDKNNYIWIATGNTIFIVNLADFSLENFQVIATIPFKDINIRNIYKDHNNNIWVTSRGNGIYRFIGNLLQKDFRFIKYEPKSTKNKLSSESILGLNQDAAHNFWVSTQTGLNKLTFNGANYTNPTCKKYFKGDKGLRNNGILSTFLDTENKLWIATRNGLHLYNNKKDNFTYFGKKEGLTNTFVYNIIEDDSQNLWLSTNGGLFRFNKKTKVFSNYTTKDGLQSMEFNIGGIYKDKNQLYFGGINGYNRINLNKIDELDKEDNLIFTNFSIKEKLIIPTSNGILKQSISKTKEIAINYTDFPFNLSFSALDFRPNSNIEYVYKLLPDDQQWNSIKDKNSIQLLTLSPKNYTLQVQGKSRGKLWNKAPLQLNITVNPPWYRSTLAYIMYLLLFLSVVYFLYTTSLQRKLAGQEAKRLHELDALKSRFITNITHEFRTPLTIILGFLDNLKEQFSDNKETITTLNTIEQNNTNLLSLVNQMLDLSKLEKGSLKLNIKQNDIVSYIKHLVNSFENIAKNKSIQLEFNSNIEELIMDFDAEKIRQIFTNLISNALKFSNANSTISVQLEKNKNILIIKVKDEGFGIPKEDLNHIFDRFYQVDNSNFKISQGTGIGLALTKELVNLLQGNIKVQSKINKGTTFTLSFPITNIAKNSSEEQTEIEEQIKTKHTIVPKTNSKIELEDANTVLIVEDNEDMARYIDLCLSPKFKTLTAPNGKEGLKIAIEQIPDIIITDVMMPIMDGYELTKNIQANEITNHIPVIILTSKAMQSERIEGIRSGAEVYLTKPFSKKELILRIEKLIEKRKILQKKYQVNKIVAVTNTKVDSNDKSLHFLQKAIDFVHNNLENPDYNSKELSSDLMVSESQLYRKLKAINNQSTAVFIRKIRLNKAKEMLENTTLTISEIAYTTGFKDPNWFSRIFKKEFSCTPKEIRE